MRITFFIVAKIFLSNAVFFAETKRPDSDVPLTNFISNFGYPIEVHKVTTEDGYILEMHRISNRDKKPQNGTIKEKKVALLMHGLIGCSASWVVAGPNRSLAFILADKGYDVWLGNNRGNTFSKKHKTKLETSFDFWDFSWHELGIFDLPSMIDYVLKNTNQEKLLYTCFSQGCTQMFVMGSLKPEYNKKIKLAVALAPAVYFSHLGGIVKYLWFITYLSMYLSESWGYFEILPAVSILRIFTKYFCRKGVIWQHFCIFGIFTVVGFGYDEIDRDLLVDILAYLPAGSSWKQIIHYGFSYFNKGTFKEYDYGRKRNLELYNSTTPPDYPLENVNFPIAIYHGINDAFVSPKDVNFLAKKLPNLIISHLVSEKKLNHYDFVFGLHVKELVYNRALKLIDDYN